MANNLLIERVLDTRFELTLNGEDPISDNAPNLTTFGDVCHFKSKNGANLIKKQNVLYSEITVRDTFGGTGDFTFVNIGSLWTKLIELKFFNGLSTGSGGGSTTFAGLLDTEAYFGNDGKVPIVNESELKLDYTTFYNFNKFIQLEDVEITSLIENKIVGVSLVGGVPKLTLVDKPDDGEFYFSAVGGFDYADLETHTTPISYTSGYLQLTNDAEGESTFTGQSPYGVSSVWDETTNTFDWSSLSVGDEVFVRVHIDLTTTASNQTSSLYLLFGEGTSQETYYPIDAEINRKSAGSKEVIREVKFYVRTEEWRSTPCKVIFESENNASIKVFGWHPYIIRKSVNIIDVNDDNYKTFTISKIEANLNDVNVNTGSVKIGYNGGTDRINKIIFDIEFSKYLKNYSVSSSFYDFYLNFIDKTSKNSYTSKVISFTDNNGYYCLSLNETTNYDFFFVNDKIEVFLTASSESTSIQSPYVTIDGFQVVALGKTDLNSWEDNDKFQGWVGNVYYVGRVLNSTGLSLPSDINDTSKISLAIKNLAL